MMERICEPELMDEATQAEAYAEADFEEVNAGFAARFLELAPEAGTVIDLGCGPGDIAIRIARARPGLRVVGVDGAEAMLALARAASADAGVGARVEWVRGRVPGSVPGRTFDAVMSNSLLHHLHEPAGLWLEIAAVAEPGAPVLVVDLMRPESKDAAHSIVDEHAAGEPEILRTDFYNSLCAAFTPDEVRQQLRDAGLDLEVSAISDRHLAVAGTLPRR